MNFKIIVLILATVGSLYNIVLNIVKYRSAKNPIPESVSDVYDADTYLKWRRYSAENCRLAILTETASFVVIMVLLITNAYAAFASLFPSGEFWQMLAVLILTELVGLIVSTVNGYIETMVIEEKYGFNKSTLKRFILDVIRNFILGFLLSFMLTGFIIFSHKVMGEWMIIVFTAVVFAVTMVMSFLYPIFSRLGNKFTPLEDGELKDSLMALLTKHGYKVKAIEVMDASTRTTKSNAYFTGFGKMKTIVLYDNLIEALSPEEICAVFAHELGHGLHKDVLKQQIMNVGNLLIMAVLVCVAVTLTQIYTDFGFLTLNYGFTYFVLGIALGVVSPFISMATNAYSRFAEYRADRQAVSEGYGEAMISALKKLARENFSHLSPSRFNVVLEYSHPPLCRRIEEIEKSYQE